jgi:plastocyanin
VREKSSLLRCGSKIRTFQASRGTCRANAHHSRSVIIRQHRLSLPAKARARVVAVAGLLLTCTTPEVSGPPPAPAITLSAPSIAFSATAGGASPAPQTVSITNGGTGTLSALEVDAPVYATGQPTGWLVATLDNAVAPATLTLSASISALTAGSYSATISIRSAATGVTNSPQTLAVTFTVAAPPPTPTIALSVQSIAFSATAGGGNPAAGTINVTNSSTGTLSGLTVDAPSYASGQATGWLAASLGATTAPAVLTLSATTGTLTAGTYSATVALRSSAPGVTNSPQTITVTFTVAPAPAPTISISATTIAFSATAGGSNPAVQGVNVTNSGTATLSGLSLDAPVYGTGQPTGWLSGTLSTTTAPATITLSVVTGSLAAGNYTATMAVRSNAPGVTNSPRTITVNFTVAAPPPAPTIVLSPTSLSFAATSGGSSPAAQSVNVTNGGTGTLSGLSLDAVAHGSGQPTGWLSATLSGTTAPATITLNATTGSLAAGTYTATLAVRSSATGVTNSPQTISITFTVAAAPPAPTIALSATSVSFSATAGGAAPAAQTVNVTNAGTGTLSQLTIDPPSYTSGQPAGWLAASLSSMTAPTTLNLNATTGSLSAGTYTATIVVRSTASGVTNSPQTVTVTFTVAAAPPAPTIALSSTTASFAATAGGSDPASQTVTVNNSGTGTLSGLTLDAPAYNSGQPTGWLTASLSATTAPAVITLNASTGSLPAGTYTATVAVRSSATGVTNSPQTITVTFTVNAPAPAPTISLSTATIGFSATAGGSNPSGQTVSVSNSGTGTLSGLSLDPVAYGAGQPTGWLAAGISATTAPATITLNATTGSLVAGTYTATVTVRSSASGVTNSPQAISVTFTVAAPPPAPTIALSPTSLTFNATQGGSSPASQTVNVTNSGTGTLSGLSLDAPAYGSGQPTGWLAAALSGTTAPATVTVTSSTGALTAGTYTATIAVRSTATGVTNSPQSISVTFNVASPAPNVNLTGSAFVPPTLSVSPGATVSFTNLDGFAHNVTFTNPAITSVSNFSSGTRTVVMPMASGSYGYQCTLHSGMTGTITVP